METKNYMRIGELVKVSALPRSTIHFYLRKGLLHPPLKTSETMAYYDESHLKRLQLIQKMKLDMGMPIVLIQQKIEEFESRESENKNAAAFENGEGRGRILSPRERRRTEILNAAIQIFSQKGYQKTKVADITEALSISTGTFYAHFRNKKDLFMEVIEDVIKDIIGRNAEAIKDETDFYKVMSFRARVFYENYAKYDEILRQLRADGGARDKWSTSKINQIYHSMTQPIIREIQTAVGLGVIDEVDPDIIAYALTGMVELLSLRLSIDNKYTSDDMMAHGEVLIRRLFEKNPARKFPPAGK